MLDEGPSPEDIARFGGETAYCPECGEEIWDEAPRCPECGAWIDGRTERHTPVEAEARKRMVVIIAVLTALAFSGLLVLLKMI